MLSFSHLLIPHLSLCLNLYQCLEILLYYYYLNKTPWNDYESQFKYNTIKGKSIHTLKSVIKLVLDYMHIRAYRFRNDLPNIENLLHNEQ